AFFIKHTYDSVVKFWPARTLIIRRFTFISKAASTRATGILFISQAAAGLMEKSHRKLVGRLNARLQTLQQPRARLPANPWGRTGRIGLLLIRRENSSNSWERACSREFNSRDCEDREQARSHALHDPT